MEILKFLVAVVVLTAFIAGVIFGFTALDKKACNMVSEEIGRCTQYRLGACYIEIAPNLFINETELVYNLDNVEETGEECK